MFTPPPLKPPVAPPPSIDSLAGQLDHRKGVWWAVQSSKKVPAGSTSPQDKLASSAAEAWVKNPNPSTHAAALDAAKKADLHGPGAWAAQAAGWSHPSGATSAAAAAPAAGPALVPHAVAGSVKMSAALTAGAKLPPLPKLPAIPAPEAKVPVANAPLKSGVPTLPVAKTPIAAAPPDHAATMPKAHQPFIELGKAIQQGEKLWT